MKTNDRQLTDLMRAVDVGAAQLPDFQRGWVWDDGRIKALILSVIHNFPVGAAMFLEYGNESIHFKHKPIEGSAADPNTVPDELILERSAEAYLPLQCLVQQTPCPYED